MDVSCAFPTALSSPDDIALAESLGYARAWVYDTPSAEPRRLDDARAGRRSAPSGSGWARAS